MNAYGELVRRYESIAFRVAYLVTRDESEAADAAQDAFVRAFRGIGTFKLGQPFRPWVLRIVTNVSVNAVQAARRRTRAIQHAGLEIMADPIQPAPERQIVECERNERLMEAVEMLSPGDRTLIALRYYFELPEAEVAAVLEIARGTVKSRLHRTLERLREIIRSDYPDLLELRTFK